MNSCCLTLKGQAENTRNHSNEQFISKKTNFVNYDSCSVPLVVISEVRNVVGRLIWECEDQQPVAQVSTTGNFRGKSLITSLGLGSVLQGSWKNFSSPTEDEYSEGEVSRG